MVSKYATWTTEVHHNDLVLVEDADVALHRGGEMSPGWVSQPDKLRKSFQTNHCTIRKATHQKHRFELNFQIASLNHFPSLWLFPLSENQMGTLISSITKHTYK